MRARIGNRVLINRALVRYVSLCVLFIVPSCSPVLADDVISGVIVGDKVMADICTIGPIHVGIC
ncbi:MAG: hypothetical protein HUJ51_05585 [Eggerthellaceae bacterium]|nr:hypothetical protein [Eggerthellaceae bacterium]